MKKEDKNNYYNVEDEINFEKLSNFTKFNSDIKNNATSKNHNIKYANSDKSYFNNIIKTEENSPLFKKDDEKEVKYYNSSDFQKFNRLSNFFEYKNDKKKNISANYKLTYSSNDYSEFNKIIATKNKGEKLINNQNIKIKVVDFTKLKDNEKSLKNKMGIEKIKVVYFD